jgi:hypothetical protein
VYWDTKSVSQPSPFSFSRLKKKISVLPTTIIASLAGVLGFNITHNQSTVVDSDVLAKTFGLASEVHADTPYSQGSYSYKSLVISYWDGKEYVQLSVVQPRYYQSDFDAIELPAEALIDGEVQIQIESTKRHQLAGLALVNASEAEFTMHECSIKSVESSNMSIESDAAMFSTAKNGHFAITQPGAEINLTFETESSTKDMEESFLFSIGGVYAPISVEEQKNNKQWPVQLDEEAKAFLKEIYDYNHSV